MNTHIQNTSIVLMISGENRMIQNLENTNLYETVQNIKYKWEIFSTISEILRAVMAIICVMAIIWFLIVWILRIKKHTDDYTKKTLLKFQKNKKYIPDLFTELNESKEILRYFINGKKWKNRIIDQYNYLYNNNYGKILQKRAICEKMIYHMRKVSGLSKIQDVIQQAKQFHEEASKGEIEFTGQDKQSVILYEILSREFIERLERLELYTRAARSQYFVLTGSAGNGKTNLLCSISELLLNQKENVILLNARDIQGDFMDFLLDQLIHWEECKQWCKKHKKMFYWILKMRFIVSKKQLFFIVDAVNENDQKDFLTNLNSFLNRVLKLKKVKVIVSCRNEYYEKHYREHLVGCLESLWNTRLMEYDLKQQNYDECAIAHMMDTYKKYFKFTGNITSSVQEVLSKQLLLMRIFFEVNQGKANDVKTIRKHKIFAEYIKTVQHNSDGDVEALLNVISDIMLKSNRFDDVNLEEVNAKGIQVDTFASMMDSSVLINKTDIFLKDTIAEQKVEKISFVFDELRDYYLARRLIQNNSFENTVFGNKIISKIEQLEKSRVSCAEGIAHYSYIFFRCEIGKSDCTEEYCKKILNLYHNHVEPVSLAYSHENMELRNLGLRIILTSGLTIESFEVSYIVKCLETRPYEDGNAIYKHMLMGTLTAAEQNLTLYLKILFSLHSIKSIGQALDAIENDSKNTVGEELALYHKENAVNRPQLAMQLQAMAQLYLMFFKLRNPERQYKLENYFSRLPNYALIREQLKSQIIKIKKKEESVDG